MFKILRMRSRLSLAFDSWFVALGDVFSCWFGCVVVACSEALSDFLTELGVGRTIGVTGAFPRKELPFLRSENRLC